MLIGARQFFERRGAPTPPLPYDAEVEYIGKVKGSSAWLKLPPIPVGGVFDFRIRFALSSWGPYASSFGIKGDYPSGTIAPMFQMIFQNGIFDLPYNGYNYYRYSFNGITDGQWHEVYTQSGQFVIDGVVSSNTYNGAYMTAGQTPGFGLFGCCSYAGNLTEGAVTLKVSEFSYSVDGTEIFNGKSVRFTNELGQSESAMYDRVSGALFRNAGTGAFTIGPDKS